MSIKLFLTDALLALALGCARADPHPPLPAVVAASGAPTPVPPAATVFDLPPLPSEAFPDGPCGGFERAANNGKIASLLGGRLTITPIDGLEPHGRPYNIMAAPWTAELETRLTLERDGKKLVVFVEELMSRPGADLVGAIRKEDEQAADAFVGALSAGGLRVVGVVPRHARPDHEKALALGLYVITPDEMLVQPEGQERAAYPLEPDPLGQRDQTIAIGADLKHEALVGLGRALDRREDPGAQREVARTVGLRDGGEVAGDRHGDGHEVVHLTARRPLPFGCRAHPPKAPAGCRARCS
jgi:hypothetical protein